MLFVAMSARERFEGCLLGGAVGDAMGAGIEFSRLEELRARFGAAGVTDYVPVYGRVGAITDDTQMTLFTAEGLLRAIGPTDLPAVVESTHASYLRWLHTQGESSRFSGPSYVRDGWMFSIEGLHHVRAPGGTCLSALRGPVAGSTGAPLNDSKGCGGVMRVAPVGLVLDEPFEIACATAAITHGHPSGYLAAGVLADIVARVIKGSPLRSAATSTAQALASRLNDEVRRALDTAIEAAEGGIRTAEVVERLGAGWVAEEALSIAVYCALVADDYPDGVLLAVNHSGDSDSTGAIAGNLLGAALGRSAIPPGWLEALELADVIEMVARDLLDLRTGAPRDEQRYPVVGPGVDRAE